MTIRNFVISQVSISTQRSHILILDNRTESNLDDLGLAFRDMGIDMNEILEYVSYVDPIVPAHDVPKYPIPKETHLNFLKPGSKEVLTRPVHIHEHLPPLNPPEDEPLNSITEKDIDVVGGIPVDDDGVFKRPDGGPDGKKIKTEEEGRPTREISSVMMTTSGFISPAREGKLPESRPPNLPPEFIKPILPPITSPPFKPKDSSVMGQTANIQDKKLEKKLRKKNHDKEKRKDKPVKDKHLLAHEQRDMAPHQNLMSQSIFPREANEQLIMAERKKALKKLKMKNKGTEVLQPKKKKEKPPKQPKQGSFDHSFIEKSKFEPFQVLPPHLPPPAPSQIQAHNFLTGAAHTMFQNPMLDGVFGAQSSFIEGKLIAEPDKNKLNIFKKISKPKEEPIKQPPVVQSQMDFLSPQKFERFDTNQPSTSQQVYSDPMKKVHKLPRETTLTRVEESNVPINFSMPRNNESSFEELAMPKTPTIPRTPDMKMSQSTEKKERKKREKKVVAPDWNKEMQNSFMPDLSNPNNPFLQNLAGGFMGNLNYPPIHNPFSMPQNDMFSSSSALLTRPSFGMSQMNSMNQMVQNPYAFPLPGMDINLLQQQSSKPPKPKKVKQPKPAAFREDDFRMMQGSKFNNFAPMVPQLFHDAPQLMNVDPFPLQHHQQLSSFDQLLKEPKQQQPAPFKKTSDDKMETFDLTSSPEPMPPAPDLPEVAAPPPSFEPMPVALEPQKLPPIKEKSKEKKKKKDKDKDKEKGDKEERKKVSSLNCLIFLDLTIVITRRRKKRKRRRKSVRRKIELQCLLWTVKARATLKILAMACQPLHLSRN